MTQAFNSESMWEQQAQFCRSAENEAKELLTFLDLRFLRYRPKTYLVGQRIESQDNVPNICIVPETCPYSAGLFANLQDRCAQLEVGDLENPENPESWAVRLRDVARTNAIRVSKLRALQGAIKQIIESTTDSKELLTWISWPIRVNDYLVMVVLQLSRIICDSHPRLRRHQIQVEDAPRPQRDCPTSLLNALIDEFLHSCTAALNRRVPGAGFHIDHGEELVRRAAKKFMTGPGSAGNNLHGMLILFEACNAILTQNVAGHNAVKRLVISRPDHPAIGEDIKLLCPVRVEDTDVVGKLLELATGDRCLLSDALDIYGIGSVIDTYDANDEDLFIVHFTKNIMWEMTHAGKPLMYMRYGKPMASIPSFHSEHFSQELPRIFKGITPTQSERLLGLAERLDALARGGMLVISSNASSEATRLGNQAILVSPLFLTADLLCDLTRIDGAVLVDLNGFCHAFGVLVDGMTHPDCTPARGPRFNSAVKYAHGRSDCMVVVKCKDECAFTLPVLRAQIRRADLLTRLDCLREHTSLGDWESKEVMRVLHWLSDHRFYLSADLCTEINCLNEEAAKHLPPESIRLSFDFFAPDEDLDDSYFLPE